MKDIYWIEHDEHPSLAIVGRPRGAEWLEQDLGRLRQGGIDVLVSLLTSEEVVDLRLETEGELAAQMGIEFISYPIPDRTTPVAKESFRRLIGRLVDAIGQGKRVGAHCRGCIGRATVTTAAVMIQLGVTPVDALALIEEARGCSVPDTVEQLDWILSFEPQQ